MKKTMLVIAPVLPQASDLQPIIDSLSFLQTRYELDFIDPLSIGFPPTLPDYYERWQNWMLTYASHYDAFLGFSFGGVILQQCFSWFQNQKKKIILCSTPTFSDESLRSKLGDVISYCQNNQLEAALLRLYEQVAYPNPWIPKPFQISDPELAVQRLSAGLRRVLETDSRNIIEHYDVAYWHLFGADSNLVNSGNVIAPKTGGVYPVPDSGMRVLEDNPKVSQSIILEKLSCA